jgi:hypothetical protein
VLFEVVGAQRQFPAPRQQLACDRREGAGLLGQAGRKRRQDLLTAEALVKSRDVV